MDDDRRLAAASDAIAPPSQGTHLVLRLLSGAALAIIALACAWGGVPAFAGLALAVALIMSWEWSGMVRGAGLDISLIVHGLAVAAAIVLAGLGLAGLGLATLLAGTIIVLALEFGRRPILSAAGVAYAGLPAVALIWLRADEPHGLLAVIFVALVVVAADTGAFAAGRLLGGPRLAPAISPNKTWSGLAGGLASAAAAAAAYAYMIGAPLVALALMGFVMGAIAQMGDLAESAMKRAFNVKDASQLLPGHGGFMDRMDGLAPVAVAVAVAALFIDPQAPAGALLAGLSRGTP